MDIGHFFRGKRRWTTFVMLICFLCLSLPVNAKTLVDIDAEADIIIQYQVENAEFSLYKVADVTETYRFPVTEDFAQYKIDFDALDSDQWKNMAETLAGYVSRDKLEPLDTAVSDENGTLTFADVSVGVYLIIGSQAQDEEYIYRCKPFLAFVPLETEDGSWDYQPEYLPKPSEDPIELIDLSVIKIWKDEGLEKERPKEITVQLLKDGEVVDEVTLNAEINWKYIWEDLSSEYTWQVVEKDVPEDYTVEMTREGNVFEVVNTTEKEPDKPDELPQTGQLWWPVPILAVAGLFFFLIGCIRRRTDNEN